ncbi:MAG TPA: transglutaminase family protein [Roseimicrobium sp.]|nr:transglutaminase family protein [Roseimicrobium sp.]
MLLNIEHITLYRYSAPVQLGTHRLMLRPLEGHDVQIRSATLSIQPESRIRWLHDIFGNSIAVVDFLKPATELRIESRITVEQFNANPFDFLIDLDAGDLPLKYKHEDQCDVGPYLQRQHPADEPAIQNWIRPFLDLNGRGRTLEFLIALNKSVPLFFQYARREEPGVQSPAETLRMRSGSCRDFALLFMEAARHVGLAARFVSGYLCASADGVVAESSGATHAWAEVYLPGAGWKGFDPTCGILAADSNIRTAVARCPSQAAPIAGSFAGPPGCRVEMEVIVNAARSKNTNTKVSG